MAKIIPQGTNVNLNLEDPFEKLIKSLSAVSQIQNIIGYGQAQQQKKDTTLSNSLITINGLIDRADDPSDLVFAQQMYDSLDIDSTDNSNVRIVHDITAKNISNSRDSFNSILSSGNEIGSLMTSKHEVTDRQGNTNMKLFDEMNRYEVIDFFNRQKGDDGAYGRMTGIVDKINNLEVKMASEFGMNAKGQYTKMPKIRFSNFGGGEINPSEYMTMLNRYKNRINMFVEAGFNDKELNEEEAMAIVRGNYGAYESLRKRRDQEFKYLAQNDTNMLRGIDSKISGLSKEDEGGLMNIFSDPNNPLGASIRQEFQNDPSMVDYYQKYITDVNPSDGIEIGANLDDNIEKVMFHMSRNTKQDNLNFYNKLRTDVASQREVNQKAAESWGFGYYGAKPTAADLFGGGATVSPGTGEPGPDEPGTGEAEQGLSKGSTISNFLDEYGEEALLTGGAAAIASQSKKLQSAVSSATTHLKDVYKLSENNIVDMMNDVDFKALGKQLGDVDNDIASFKKSLPTGLETKNLKPGDTKYKQYKALLKRKEQLIKNSKHVKNILTKMEGGDYFQDFVDGDLLEKPPTKPGKGASPDELKEYNKKMRDFRLANTARKAKFSKKLTSLLKESDKWNLFNLKRTVGTGMRQTYRTTKDLANVIGKGGLTVTPVDAAVHAWFLGDKFDMGWKGKTGVALGAHWTAKKIISQVKKRGIMDAVMNPKLQSKVGGILLKKYPLLAAKMGIKMGVGGAVTGLTGGIGTAAGLGMAAWTIKDIYGLIQDAPEIKQAFIEYLESTPEEVETN